MLIANPNKVSAVRSVRMLYGAVTAAFILFSALGLSLLALRVTSPAHMREMAIGILVLCLASGIMLLTAGLMLRKVNIRARRGEVVTVCPVTREGYAKLIEQTGAVATKTDLFFRQKFINDAADKAADVASEAWDATFIEHLR